MLKQSVTIECPLCHCKLTYGVHENGAIFNGYNGVRFIQCPQATYAGAVYAEDGNPYDDHFILFDSVSVDVFNMSTVVDALVDGSEKHKPAATGIVKELKRSNK